MPRRQLRRFAGGEGPRRVPARPRARKAHRRRRRWTSDAGRGGRPEPRWRAGGARCRPQGRCRSTRLKVLALDYGSARTGVAVSDPTGTVARPLCTVERAGTQDGLTRLRDLVAAEEAERVVVGLPLTLRGEQGEQAH